MKENRRVVIKSTIAPQRKTSASRSGSRENRVRQQSSGKRRVRSPSPHSNSKVASSSYGINFIKKDQKSRQSKQSDSKRQPLGNISQISARESNHRQSQQQVNNDLTTELDAFQQHTFAELHKRIELLESQKRALKARLKDHSQPLCCCKDLRGQFEEKERALTQLADHWRGKTQLLVAKYYKALEVLRED